MKKFLRQYSLTIYNIIFYLFCFNLFLNHFFKINFDYTKTLRVLLIPALILYVGAMSRKNKHVFSKNLALISLSIAWIADLLVIINNNYLFNLNLIILCFSLVFSFFFVLKISFFSKTFSSKVFDVLTFIFFMILYYNYYKLIKTEFDLQTSFFKISVLLYMLMLAIFALCITNILSQRNKKELAFRFFIPAVFLFMFSFFLSLGIKMKNIDFSFMQILITVTLYYAYYYMSKGYARYLADY